MTSLMVLHWGQVSQQINVIGGNPSCATIKGPLGRGNASKSAGSSSIKKPKSNRARRATRKPKCRC